ncbi:MAG: prolyl-tRNA synthetase [Parasphingorhabdus sp.]|jgi:prolyl-tRNA synthetase
MRTSRFLLATLKETPSDAEVLSHQLMLRAGLIRRVAAGVYNWLPMGLRVVRNVEKIVRREMNNAGAQEILMPTVQPAELWQESGRWDDYGPELLRLKDRHQRDFCLGPTHEEVVTTIAKNEIRSYRQLPTNLYQIQTKFRDEIRPRFGVMRGREFIMKDAYSFDLSPAGMGEAYEVMRAAYVRIFESLGLDARAVEADSGAIGGNFSHEFHVLADSGEDGIAICDAANFAANVETISCEASSEARAKFAQAMQKVATPGQHTISDLAEFLSISSQQTLKTLVVEGDVAPIALVIRGDHELNSIKAEKIEGLKTPLQMASADSIKQACGAEPGSIGPVNTTLRVVADFSTANMTDFVCGANEDDHHLTGVNWGRDLPEPEFVDLRKAVQGDPCPTDTSKTLDIRRGIEVGHIFQLGTKYSECLQATCLDDQGKPQPLYMGCYGIGITRVVAAAIEQNHDDNGIIWPDSIAPFDVCLVAIGYQKSELVSSAVDKLYEQLKAEGFEVLLDDRKERPGVMFSEMDLIGIPHRIVIGERSLKGNMVEYKNRRSGESMDVPLDSLLETLTTLREK